MIASPDKVAGFALGALLAGDREAASVQDQVAAPFHTAVAARMAQVSGMADAHDKREAVAKLIGVVRPEPASLAALPTSARALLERAASGRATRADRQIDPDLVAMLKRLAAQLNEQAQA